MCARSKNRALIMSDRKRRKDPEVTVNPGAARNEPELSIQDSTRQSQHPWYLFSQPAKQTYVELQQRTCWQPFLKSSQQSPSGQTHQCRLPTHSHAANICQGWLNADATSELATEPSSTLEVALVMNEETCCISHLALGINTSQEAT